MDLVLGLSLTSTAVRWVLVEGTTGEGAPIDRGSLDIPATDSMDADLLLSAVLTPDVLDDARIHAAGVTCTPAAAPAATAVIDALIVRGYLNVVAIPDGDAATALATGVADITDFNHVAVCIVEPDSALVALAAPEGVTVERIDRPLDGADVLELTSSVIVALDDRHPDVIFVIGSDDVDVIVSSFEAIVDVPVLSAAEADLALARGAALAAARTVVSTDAQAPKPAARIGVLATVLSAAIVTFVVSLSIAFGLSLTDSSADQSENAAAAAVPVVPSQKAMAPTKVFALPATPKLAMTMVAAAPPAPVPVAAPVDAPPQAYQPPAPAYVPPPYQEPRLRDRILERIPILNRFHEPQG